MIALSQEYRTLAHTKGVFHKFTPARGKNCQILFLPTDTDTTHVCIDTENPIRISSECQMYAINNALGTCVGSLFLVNKKRINFEPRFFYVRETEAFSTLSTKAQTGLGGVYAYVDKDYNVMVTPALPTITDYVVLE